MKKEIRLITKGFATIFLAMIVVWILGAYLSWDLSWITRVGEWEMVGRMSLALGLLIGTIPIGCVLFYSEIYA